MEIQSKGYKDSFALYLSFPLANLLWNKARCTAVDAPKPLPVLTLTRKLLLDMCKDLALVQAVVCYLFTSHINM